MSLVPGKNFGKYQVVKLLGRGGMGEVYLATDRSLNRQVAIKVLSSDLIESPDQLRRFSKEGRLAAALSHPNICTIYDTQEFEGQTYICMEYVEGVTLRQHIAAQPMKLPEVLDIAIQIADALDEARKKNVIHRDIKSSNILLTSRKLVKILDFGLAKQLPTMQEGHSLSEVSTASSSTDPGEPIRGTLVYMSPEAVLGKPLDHRSDIFSFGVVLYEMLAGRVPFDGNTTAQVFDAILHQDPTPVTRFNNKVPDSLVRVLAKMLEKDVENRYQSVHEVWIDLRRVQKEMTLPASISSSQFEAKEKTLPFSRMVNVGLILLILASVFSFLYIKGFTRLAKIDSEITTTEAGKLSASSIVILPFKNKSGDKSLDKLQLPLTQIVINELIPSKEIKVFPYDRLYQISELINQVDKEVYGMELLKKVGRFGNSKTLVEPTIFRFGNVWEILLEFKDGSTGDTIDSRKVMKESAERGELVLFNMLGDMTSEIKGHLNIKSENLSSSITKTGIDNSNSSEMLVLFNQGINQFYQGKNLAAVASLKNAIQKDAHFPLVHAYLALAYKNLGQDDLALSSASQAMQMKGEQLSMVDAYFIDATNAAVTYDYATAIKLYEQLKRIYSDRPEIHFRLGELNQKLFLLDKALASYKAAVGLDPNYAMAYQHLGIVYDLKHTPNKALLNLNRALEIHNEIGNDEGKARVLSATGDVYQNKNEYARAREFYEQALQIDKQLSNESGIAEDLHRLAIMHLEQGNLTQASTLIQQAIQLFSKIGDSQSLAEAYIDLGNSHLDKGNSPKALDYFQKALNLAGYIKSKNLLARGHDRLSQAYYYESRFDEAEKYARQAREEYSLIDDKRGIAFVTGVLGDVAYELGNYGEAMKLYQDSLSLSNQIDDRILRAINLGLVGNLYFLQARYEKALELRSEELKIFQEMDHTRGASYSELNIARFYSSLGAYDKAIPIYLRVLKYFRDVNNKRMQAYCLLNLGQTYELKDTMPAREEAERYYQEALRSAGESASTVELIAAKGQLALLWMNKGESSKVKALYEEILKSQYDRSEQKHVLSQLHLLTAMISFGVKDYDRTLKEVEQVIAVSEHIGLREDLFRGYWYAGRAYQGKNQPEEAARFYRKATAVVEAIASDNPKNKASFLARSDVRDIYDELKELPNK